MLERVDGFADIHHAQRRQAIPEDHLGGHLHDPLAAGRPFDVNGWSSGWSAKGVGVGIPGARLIVG
jgi:hypothetical protein